jgi:hypothetical protein
VQARATLLMPALLAVVLLHADGNAARAVRFPLRVAADARHLEDQAGRPFLVVGDTAWSLVAQLSQADIERYVDDRMRRGFNAIIVNLIEHKFASRAPANREGVAPFLASGDFARPNPAYFDAAHRAIALAGQRGLSVWLCPAYLGWDGGDEGFFKEMAKAGPDAVRLYGEFVGRRFRDLSNIVWMLGGDYALPPSERWVVEQMVRGLRDGGARQLMTAHGGQTSGVDTFGDQEWLAIETVYSYVDDLRPLLLHAYQRRPLRPFVLIVSTYEGVHDARPARIRRQAWAAMLSGAAGQFFGNNPMWHFDGPTLFPHAGDWRQALDSTGSRDMSRLGRFFSARRWWDLVPERDGGLVTVGSPGGAVASAARTADGALAVIYVAAIGAGSAELTLNLHDLGAGVTAQWFNPARDERPRDERGISGGRDGQKIVTPGDNGTGANDWVLILETR